MLEYVEDIAKNEGNKWSEGSIKKANECLKELKENNLI